jgi:hypothetical protein
VDSKAVGNKRAINTNNRLHEALTTTSTIDLTEEDLGGLRNATELLELLELVPGGNVEATVETSLSCERGANALLSAVGGPSVRAEVSRIVGLVPDGEATSTMGNENRNNATNELGEIFREWVDTSGSRARLVVEHGSTPLSSNTGDGELNPELASPRSLHEVDVAVQLLQGNGTTARVKEVEVEIRADTSSSKSLDLVESSLTLGVVNVKERSFVLSAELHAIVVSGETTTKTAPSCLLHVNLVGNSARPASVLPGWAPSEGIDHAVNGIGEGRNTPLR